MKATVVRSTGIGLACFVAGLGLYLLKSDDAFLVYIVTFVFMYASLASSLDLLVGLTGRISMAHATFFGLGAYVSAISMIEGKWPFPFAVLLAVIVTGLAALGMGAVTIRIKGMYFALATTSLGITFVSMLQLPALEAYTGGARGLIGIPTQPYLKDPAAFYAVFLALLIVGVVLKHILSRSTAGLRMIALRDDEELARTLGIFTDRYKVAAFVIASSLAGLTGAFSVLFFGFLAPIGFDIWVSFSILVWVLVGGVGTALGPVLGAALLWSTPQALKVQPDLARMIYGALLILTISLNRKGIMGLIDRIWLLRGRILEITRRP